MVEAGLDCGRINCAHDGPEAWRAMISNLRHAAKATGRVVRIHMDRRPKIRTGAVPVGGVRLRRGDVILLTRDLTADGPARRGPDGRLQRPLRVGCTVPEIVERAEVGQPLWLDDGRLGGIVTGLQPRALEVTVTITPFDGYRLRPNKGVNVPDTDLGIPVLTEADSRALPFVALNADMVGLSFVQRPGDVLALRSALDTCGGEGVATVVKVETRRAVDDLPAILLRGDVGPGARGDDRPWRSSGRMRMGATGRGSGGDPVPERVGPHARHLGTQAPEGLTRNGLPSRAEISDAGGRARRARDAQQGAQRRGGDPDARPDPRADAAPPTQEALAPAREHLMGALRSRRLLVVGGLCGGRRAWLGRGPQ